MFGVHIDRLFAIKCLLVDYPFQLIGFFLVSTSLVLAYLVRIVEYTDELALDGDHKWTDFKYMGDALYYVYITYLTVGYGDYYPKTNLGRVFGITAALMGSYLNAVFIIALANKLNPTTTEIRVRDD
jgi:hypothetical protein